MSSTHRDVLVEPLTEAQIHGLPTYAWDVAEIGHAAPPMTHQATAESIARYCRAVRTTNPLYLDADAARRGPFGGIVAPPAYIFMCAPQRRGEVMHAHGYASPEEKGERATPYAEARVAFQRPIRLGDAITSTVALADKYERRGSQFMTWHIAAQNQRGEEVASYDYTIIWRQGPRQERSVAAAGPPVPAAEAPSSDPADALGWLAKTESQEEIDAFGELTRVRPRVGVNLHTDPGFAHRTIFGGTVNMGVATAAYCSELVERAYGPAVLLRPGASLEYKGIRPIRAGDEIALHGRVTARRADALDCEIRVVNQDGWLCGIGLATIVPA